MIIHIVKNNETAAHILEIYHVSIEELKSYNTHITDFNNLICGMKVKIPLLSEEVEQVLQYSEGFITPYYDKIREADISKPTPNHESVEEKVVNAEIVVETPIREESTPDIKKEKSVVVMQQHLENTQKSMRKAYPGVLPPKSTYHGNEIPK